MALSRPTDLARCLPAIPITAACACAITARGAVLVAPAGSSWAQRVGLGRPAATHAIRWVTTASIGAFARALHAPDRTLTTTKARHSRCGVPTSTAAYRSNFPLDPAELTSGPAYSNDCPRFKTPPYFGVCPISRGSHVLRVSMCETCGRPRFVICIACWKRFFCVACDRAGGANHML